MAKKVIIIGGGIGGLATAALLAKDGYAVKVIEKNSQLGGRARTFEQDGFVFDMGPSWYMMPDAFEKYFALFGKKPSDFYSLVRLDSHYKVFFDQPHRIYEVRSDLNYNLDWFEKTELGTGEKLRQFLAKSKYLYETAMKELVFLDYQSLRPFLKPSILFNLFKLNLFESFHHYTASYFKNKDLQKILEFTTVFLGGSPYNTPAFYTLITHTDFNLGIWYPMEGMHQIVKALESLCRQYNAEICLSEQVKKIEVEQAKAKKVITDKRSLEADIVICNADYHFAETELLDKAWQSYPQNYWQKKITAPSGFLVYLGVNKKVKNLAHHNLYFSSSWESHFKDVYARPSWPQNPSYYVHCPSKTDSSVAPPGCDAVFVLVPVAAGLKDSDKIKEDFSQKVIKHLENLIDDNLQDHIKVKKIFSHQDFIDSYHAYKGAAFGLAHNLWQTAMFRPKNKSRKVKNLYYVGQYTNPGVGVPICLISAQIVHKAIKNNES